MVITITGQSVTGKGSASVALAEILNYKEPPRSTGYFFRQAAIKAGLGHDLPAFRKKADENPALDQEIDYAMWTFLHSHFDCIGDGRLAKCLAPRDAFNILFICDEEVRGQRAFDDDQRKEEKVRQGYLSPEHALQELKRRDFEDRERFAKIYNPTIYGPEHRIDRFDDPLIFKFNMIVDTSKISAAEVAIMIAGSIKKKK